MFYRSFIDTIPPSGVTCLPLTLPTAYTVQCIFEPGTRQGNDNAIIFSNLHTTLGYQGLSLSLCDSSGSQVIFSYGAGEHLIISGPIAIHPHAANYFAATIADTKITVYLNGKKVWVNTDKGRIEPSDRPVMIGNGRAANTHFNGHVYEVAITKEIIDSVAIGRTAEAMLK